MRSMFDFTNNIYKNTFINFIFQELGTKLAFQTVTLNFHYQPVVVPCRTYAWYSRMLRRTISNRLPPVVGPSISAYP